MTESSGGSKRFWMFYEEEERCRNSLKFHAELEKN